MHCLLMDGYFLILFHIIVNVSPSFTPALIYSECFRFFQYVSSTLSVHLRCWRCCFSSEGEPEVVEDNCCGCNVAAFRMMAPSEGLDLVYVTYHVDVGETPFFVALDHRRRAIVISIRGTLSMKVRKRLLREGLRGILAQTLFAVMPTRSKVFFFSLSE